MSNRVAALAGAARCETCDGELRITTDALGRTVEKCETCKTRKTLVPTANGVAKVPGGEQRAVKPGAPLPPPEYGKPCPHCGQKVRKKKPDVQTRYCVECGTPFVYTVGGTGRGFSRALYTCPKHREVKS